MAYIYPVGDISVNGYTSIKSLENFELNKLNVLIGSNGAGKSNFISIFRILNEIAEGNLQSFVRKHGGAHNLLFNGPKVTKKIEIEINFGQNGYKCELIPTVDDTLVFENEWCNFQGHGYDSPYGISTLTNGKE